MMRLTCHRTALAALALALAAFAVAPRVAAADAAAKAEAQDHIAKATALHDQGKLDAALGELTTAYTLDPIPDLLYAIAQVHVQLGQCPQAITFYNRFLASKPAAGPAAAAREAITACKTNPPPAVVVSPPVEPAPPPVAPPPVAPPPVVPPPAARPVALRVAPAWYTDKLGDALAGAGVIAGVVGGVLYHSGLASLDQANTATTYPQHASAIDSARTDRTYAYVLGAGGAALLTAGLVHYALADRDDRGGGGVGMVPASGGGLVTLSGRF
jgi:tetratricopeptide (TPR) repeat protein